MQEEAIDLRKRNSQNILPKKEERLANIIKKYE